jgi:pimeloyl-ACP methyl ester carboxylesterase
MADELRQGLVGAGIGPPYVLVGHSIGGIIARRFAVRYGGEVAGIVLVDSSHEDQARRRRADGWWRGAPRTLWYALRTPNRMTCGNGGFHVKVGPGREEGATAAVDRPGRDVGPDRAAAVGRPAAG